MSGHPSNNVVDRLAWSAMQRRVAKLEAQVAALLADAAAPPAAPPREKIVLGWVVGSGKKGGPLQAWTEVPGDIMLGGRSTPNKNEAHLFTTHAAARAELENWGQSDGHPARVARRVRYLKAK